MERIKNFYSTKQGRIITGIISGAVVGYLYYIFIGCNSGTCPITSSPWTTMLYFSLAGVVMFLPKKEEKLKKEQKDNTEE